jgi:hypothetical protein
LGKSCINKAIFIVPTGILWTSYPGPQTMVLVTQFASGRSVLPSASTYYTAQSGGSTTTPRTLHLVIQGENPAGCNFISAAQVVTIGAGDRLQITLPEALQLPGEKWDAFVISASTAGTAGTFRVLTRIPTTDPLGVAAPFPLSRLLSTDDHFGLGLTVANPAALPANPAIGSRRGVLNAANGDPLGFVYEFEAGSVAIVNDLTVLPALNGRWLRVGGFSTEVADLSAAGGDRQDVRSILEQSVRVSSYACDGSNSRPANFWLANTGSVAIPSGQRVMINVSINDVPRSAKFEGLVRATFLGYANIDTGLLRTTLPDNTPMRGIGQEVIFENKKTDLLLEDDLQTNEAYVLSLRLNLIPAYLNGAVPPSAIVKVFPTIAVQAGSYSEAGEALGDLIYPEYDRCLVVPGRNGTAISLKGSGMVNSRSFTAVPPDILTAIPDNATTKILINGDGDRYPETVINPQLPNEAVRAIVAKAAGASNPSAWSPISTLAANSTADITITHPSDGTFANIRPDYPDFTIAGLVGKAELNAASIDVYIRKTVVIFPGFPPSIETRVWNFGVVDAPTQLVQITNWTSGTAIASVPTAPTPDFCLFQPIGASIAASVGVGDFVGDYEVAYAYRYSGTAITSITHATIQGCLPTLALTIGEIEESAKSWAPGVQGVADLRGLIAARIFPYQTRFVLSIGDPYRFDPASLGVDDGTNAARYVRPNHIPADQPGRWVQDDSSTWYTGIGAPPGALGEVGDQYLDDEGGIHRKDAPGAWTYKFRLRGTIWLTGTNAPLATEGEPRDFYIEDNDGVIWQKNLTGVWGKVGSIRVDWFDGNGGPGLSLGKLGDYYYDRQSGLLYRKVAIGWDQRAQLKGSDGNKIYTASGGNPPTNATGIDDDWAIDPVTGDLWNKQGGAWSNAGNIKGPQGPTGPSGGGGGGGASAATLYDFLLLKPGQTPSYTGTPTTWGGLYYTNLGELLLDDDQGNTSTIILDNRANTFTKAQKVTPVTISGVYVGPEDTYTIDPTLSNYYRIDLGENPAEVLIDPNYSVDGGENFTLLFRPSSDYNSSVTFPSNFKFAGGLVANTVSTLSGEPRFAVTCVCFGSIFYCTMSEAFT